MANVAQIYWEKCDRTKRKTCKSQREVSEWMINKYIYLVYNRKLIQNDEFGETTFRETSFVRRLPLDKDN